MNKTIIIFDTNILYLDNNEKTDYRKFSFSNKFDEIVRTTEALDLVEDVSIMIPEIVWAEMRKQKLDKFNEQHERIKQLKNKTKMPNVNIEVIDCDYSTELDVYISNYKKHLSSDAFFVDYNVIKLPTKERFENIINRAFNKKEPFGDKSSKASDKGFKDVLLWESILEFAQSYVNHDFVLYCNDSMFNESLEDEFNLLYPQNTIKIIKEEKGIKDYLQLMATEKGTAKGVEITLSIEERVEKFVDSHEFIEKIKDSYFFEAYLDAMSNSCDIKNIVYVGNDLFIFNDAEYDGHEIHESKSEVNGVVVTIEIIYLDFLGIKKLDESTYVILLDIGDDYIHIIDIDIYNNCVKTKEM